MTTHARGRDGGDRGACGACRDPRMVVDDMRFDCRRCARIVGEPRPRVPDIGHEPEPDPVRSFSASESMAQGMEIPAVSYFVPGAKVWRAECHLLGAIQHAASQLEAEVKLAHKLRSLPRESLDVLNSKDFRVFSVRI